MNWFYLALIAPAIYASSIFIDKYLLVKEVKNYRAMPIYTSVVALVGGSLVWFIFGMPILGTRDTLIVLTTGILASWSLVFYFKALSIEESSIINILFQTSPVFTLILSLLFIRENISLTQYSGFFLILISSIMISIRRQKRKFKITQAFYLILVSNLLYSISAVMMKFALDVNRFIEVVSYESWGVALGGLSIYLTVGQIRKAFQKSIKVINRRALGIISVNEGIFILSKSLTFLAFSLGPVTLVSVLENSQAFYAIFYGYFLTLLFPNTFKEDIRLNRLFIKIIAVLILIAGIYLIY